MFQKACVFVCLHVVNLNKSMSAYIFPNQTACSDVAHSSTSVLYIVEHAHMRHACPPDLSHTHPRNYDERTGWCQRGEAGAVFWPASGR